MNPRRRLVNSMRSPRVAALLLALVVGVLTVSVVTPASIAAPLRGPVLLALGSALIACTAACAWERSGHARVLLRGGGWASAVTSDIELHELSVERATQAADEVLRGLGLRVRATDGGMTASRGTLAVLGSPIFHWALVALLASVGIGRAIRHEGVAMLYSGTSVIDSAETYTGTEESGPLFADRFTGVSLELVDARRSLVADGIDRGAATRIRATDPRGGGSVTRWVYPNNPLRLGRLMLNRVDAGPAVVLGIASAVATTASPPSPTVTQTVPLVSVAPNTESFSATMSLVGSGDGATEVAVRQLEGGRIAVTHDGPDGASRPQVIAPGEAARIGDVAVTFVEPITWASIAIVNDPSVSWLYASMVLALAGAAAALLWPHRAVRVTPADARSAESGEPSLRVEVLARRIDPAFSSLVTKRIREALDSMR